MSFQLRKSLRGKTLLIVLVALTGLVAGLYALSRAALLRGFSSLESDFARQNLEQASSGLANELDTLRRTTDQFADLDQTRKGASSRESGKLAAEFSNSALAHLRVSVVGVLDGAGHVLLWKAAKGASASPLLVQQGRGSNSLPKALLEAHPGQKHDRAGILMTPSGLMLVDASPISGSGAQGGLAGTLILGRALDANEITHLVEITHLPVEIKPSGPAASDPGFQRAARALPGGKSVLLLPHGQNSLAAYQALEDISGRPVALMRILLPRKIYQQGQTIVLQFLLLLLAAGFLFGAVMLFLLEHFVISRVAGLSERITGIGSSGNMASRLGVSGKDELAHLGTTINRMLDDLQRSQIERDEERTRLAIMVERMPAALWTADSHLQIASAMGAGLAAVGLSAQEAAGMSLMDFFRTSDPGFPAVAAHRKALAGESVAFETAWDTRRFEAHVQPLREADGTLHGVIGVALDITDRERLVDQLRQSQKMQAVGELAGGVAHDFNNLLMVVKGHAQLLSDRLADSPSLRHNIEQVEKAADRAASLTRQLLAFSRKQVLQPRVLDMNDVVGGMIKMFSRVIGENIEMAFLPGGSLGRVKADPGQVEQVLLNLVVNARDAMPQVGRLTIETGNAELDGGYAMRHASVEPGTYVMLTVTDTGCGMSPETQERIFEPFFTTKGPGKGTGLGLATVYGVVKQSGGYIWVYSEVGRGTTFKIYLPRVMEEADLPAEDAEAKGPERGMETILFVEDEQSVRQLVGEYLGGTGYQVIEACDAEQALELAAAQCGTIHILITDVVMPHMSGPELAAQLGASRPGIKVLYVSGYTDDTVFRHGVLEGGVAFLQKPFSLKALGQKIREVLGARPGVASPQEVGKRL